MNRTLLVGAGGPIGIVLHKHLLGAGVETIATSRTATASILQLDVNDADRVKRALDEIAPTTVVYLANPEPTSDHRSMLASLERFLALATGGGVQRFVFASSAAVYGTATPEPRSETSPLRPETKYAKWKMDAEKAFANASESAILLRVFNVYGPGMRSSLLNRMFSSSPERPEVFDSPTFVRDYVHVNDVSRAFTAAIVRNVGGAVINVGTGRGTSNTELLSVPGARAIPVPSSVHSWSTADTTRLNEDLDVVPNSRWEMIVHDPDGLG